MTAYMIRQACEQDAASMVGLLQPIIEAGCFTSIQSVTFEEQLRFIRDFPPAGVFHVAACECTGKILGMQDVLPTDSSKAPGTGLISTFVAMDRQREGIGSRLMEKTLASARERGFCRLVAVMRADNPLALRFYQGQGFRVEGSPEGGQVSAELEW